jgi:glycosidase
MTKIALAIMYNIPGIPCVYQGTEIADSGYKDPFNRKPYAWDNQDEEMKSFVKRLGEYRKNNVDILGMGDAKLLYVTEKVLAFQRQWEGKKIVVAVNRTDTEQQVELPISCNTKTVFKTNNSTVDRINPYGIIFMRED